MKYLKYTLGLLGLVILWSACSEDLFTQVVELEIPEHESGISISADFIPWYNDVVKLEASKGIQEVGSLEHIEDAKVLFKQGDMVLKSYEDQSSVSPNSAGYYLNRENLRMEAGTAYTLEVEKEGFPKATATQVLPEEVLITNLEYIEQGNVDPDGYRTDKISITFTDPGGSENYYGIKASVYYRHPDGSSSGSELYIYNDIDPLIERGVNQTIIFNDGVIDGQEITLDLNLGLSFKDDPDAYRIHVEFFNITEDKYLFERSLRIYEDSGFNPFVEPVIVHENVEGGHGLFSLYQKLSYRVDIN